MSKINLELQSISLGLNPVYLSLTPYYNYFSVSSTLPSLSTPAFWSEIYHQTEVIDDWEEVDSEFFQYAVLDEFESDPDIALSTLFWYQYPTLASFFSSQRIDIPLCFRKSKSLQSPTMITPQVRLLTMLMRGGRKTFVMKQYSTAVNALSSRLYDKYYTPSADSDWRFVYSLFSQLKFIPTLGSSNSLRSFRHSPVDSLNDKYSQEYAPSSYYSHSHHRVQAMIYEEWLKYLPLFSFYVRKVDKLKRRHSRGKTGKYNILWKYVPKYKRFITVLRWFTKDVRFQKSRTFYLRLLRSLEIILFDNKSSLAYKFRHFVHHYVFQNHKKTLLKTLRSVS